MKPVISVVISTYNRERSLAATMESIVAQESPPDYELIVVDNRCTDGTAELVRQYAQSNGRVRYVFEGRQGVSYGRNAGIAAARARLIAFTDDDVMVPRDWLTAVAAAFERAPGAGIVGGKVLPRWPVEPPKWLTRRHWAPLALLDYESPQMIDAHNRRCLITANMAVRREVFAEIGLFEAPFQKTIGSSCSIEDRELQERYWRAGGRCWFDPSIVVYADIQLFRLKRRYHRQWHFSHGELNAVLRDPEFERSNFHLFGIPGHALRRFAGHSLAGVLDLARLRVSNAFSHELEARFFAGFIRKRLSLPGPWRSIPHETSKNR